MIEHRPLLTVFRHLVLIGGVAIVAFPIWVAFVASTLSLDEVIRVPMQLVPGTHFIENYKAVLAHGTERGSAAAVGPMMWNSLIMALTISIGKIAISIISAFAFVYFRFPLRKTFFWMIFVTLMLPVEVRIFPTYKVAADLGLINTYAGLTLPLTDERPRIREPLGTGVHVIDALLTCGQGQRMGIFAGSGVGKSVFLGMMSRYTSADVVVIALIGERGREVNEFIEPTSARKDSPAASSSSPPATSRRSRASKPRSPPRPSPNTSAITAGKSSCSWIPSRGSRWRSAKSASPPANRRPRAAIPLRCSRCCRSSSSEPGRPRRQHHRFLHRARRRRR